MKTHLRLIFCAIFIFAQSAVFSQIDYSEDFEDYQYDWDSFYFYDLGQSPCSGSYSFGVNLYEWSPYADATSPQLGVSNGSEATLTFDYKLMDYNGGDPPVDATLNSGDWGYFEISYASSAGGPFTLIETIDPENHIESTSCATKTFTFTPAPGPVYIQIYAEIGESSNDFFIYLDNISLEQEEIVCSGTPAASATVASTVYACNSATINLSLDPFYGETGISYQWQSSIDGETFSDVAAGGDMASYSATQTETTWYRAVVTCDNSGESINSTPVQVVQSGMPCYCDVDFYEDVEPITMVSFAGIENTSSASVNGSPGVEDFTGVAPGEVFIGQDYDIAVEGNTNGFYETYITVFIDFNHNGDFSDEGESFEIGYLDTSTGTDGQQVTGSITIPADAMTGITFMRVFKLYDAYTSDPCSSDDGYGYGQAEDYLLNVTCGTEAPVADEVQNFCSEGTVADLIAEGDTVVWYNMAEEGDVLAETDALVDGTTYYAAQVPDGGCESEMRTAVMVSVTVVAAPTGVSEQSFDVTSYPLVSDIEVEVEVGAVINWYASEEDALAGENALSADTAIDVNATYYITQTINGCESVPFVVGVTLGNETFAFGTFKYYPNPVSNMLNMSYTNTITGIEVYNLVGQRVIEKSYVQNEVQLDMSQLTAGTYMVKVITVDASSTIKVVKQ